jgi:hypothetical protein
VLSYGHSTILPPTKHLPSCPTHACGSPATEFTNLVSTTTYSRSLTWSSPSPYKTHSTHILPAVQSNEFLAHRCGSHDFFPARTPTPAAPPS